MSETLNRIVTATFFATDGGYDELIRRWSALMADKEGRKELTAAHHVAYLMLRGKSLKKAFAPVTSEEKLARGCHRWDGASSAISSAIGRRRVGYSYVNVIKPSLLEWCRDLLVPDVELHMARLIEHIDSHEFASAEMDFEYDECAYLASLPSKVSAVGVGV